MSSKPVSSAILHIFTGGSQEKAILCTNHTPKAPSKIRHTIPNMTLLSMLTALSTTRLLAKDIGKRQIQLNCGQLKMLKTICLFAPLFETGSHATR
ncbi:hypothetical protein Mapa_000634 [Marchantia paleacea]|nr:hypothetical protein Mapa_000634 [Marchantia paleacea]